MSQDIKLNVEPVRSIAYGSTGASYVGVGTSLERPVRMILLQNLMDATMMVSFNGIDDHLPLAGNGYLILDVTANKTVDTGFFLSEGTRIYVKRVGVPTEGSIYFTVFYGGE